MDAVPDVVPVNVVVATPFRVCASTGFTVPRLVRNRTVVPFCTGVDELSITNAVISVLPPTGSTLVGAVTVIDEPVGASSGTLSHAVAINGATMSSAIFRLKPEATPVPEATGFPLNIIITNLRISCRRALFARRRS
jgi:hypothetical protein